MKKALKKIISISMDLILVILEKSKTGRYLKNEFAKKIMNSSYSVSHNNHEFLLAVPNEINYYRASTFETKEPETLEWIDTIPLKSVLWDIGANVGLYSLYAAKTRHCKVFSFEPSVFNLEILARNINLNNLVSNIVIVPLPLSNKLQRSSLNMTSTDWGGAMSTFGENYGHDGKSLEKIFEFETIGITISNAVKELNIPAPEYMKVDVDGIEQLILSGGKKILRNVKSLLIEVNDDFSAQEEEVSNILTKAGLVLKEKRHSDLFSDSKTFGNLYNQIWSRL